MGIDAGIVAINAKTYFWFDRFYNLQGASRSINLPFLENKELIDREKFLIQKGHYDWYDQVPVKGQGLSYTEVMELVQISKKGWSSSKDQKRRVYWMDNIIDFINEYPDDTFWIIDDHGPWSETYYLDTLTEWVGSTFNKDNYE